MKLNFIKTKHTPQGRIVWDVLNYERLSIGEVIIWEDDAVRFQPSHIVDADQCEDIARFMRRAFVERRLEKFDDQMEMDFQRPTEGPTDDLHSHHARFARPEHNGIAHDSAVVVPEATAG